MQRYPGYNPNMPGGPMPNNFQPGFPQQPGFGGLNPGFGPGPHQQAPGFNGPPHPQQFQHHGPGGCFMPAATIRKISNTTPPAQFFPPPH